MTSMTVLEDIVARIGIKMEELAESHKETERFLKDQTAETERVLKEQNAEMDRVLTAKISALSDDVDKWVGRFDNRIGYIVERILIPGIKPKLNEYGHNFTVIGGNQEYYLGKKGRRFAEVDMVLKNCTEVMVVEVKTRLTKSDVEYHLRRLKLLRENEAVSGLTGMTLFSAMAGLQIDDDAREMALNLGMYIIEMVEETKYVNVVKPTVELAKW